MLRGMCGKTTCGGASLFPAEPVEGSLRHKNQRKSQTPRSAWCRIPLGDGQGHTHLMDGQDGGERVGCRGVQGRDPTKLCSAAGSQWWLHKHIVLRSPSSPALKIHALNTLVNKKILKRIIQPRHHPHPCPSQLACPRKAIPGLPPRLVGDVEGTVPLSFLALPPPSPSQFQDPKVSDRRARPLAILL